MAIDISYNGSTIASLSAAGSEVLETNGTFLSDDITVSYDGGGGVTPTGTKSITVSGAGTTTENVTEYAFAEITVPSGSVSATTYVTNSSANGKSITPRATKTAGFVSAGLVSGTPTYVYAADVTNGSLPISTNGTYDVTNYAQAVVNVAGGASIVGLEFEKGVFTTQSSVKQPTINFSNTHAEAPFFAMMYDATRTYESTKSGILYWLYSNSFTLDNSYFYESSSSIVHGIVQCVYANGSSPSRNVFYLYPGTGPNAYYANYWISNTSFKPGTGTSSVSSSWLPNRTYNWIAVWKPTS